LGEILAADIGGTNSRFAHFRLREGRLSLEGKKWLETGRADSLGGLFAMLRESGFSLLPERADVTVLAVAGPVERGVSSSPPFIPWGIDLSSARQDYGLTRHVLINDFVAQAYACRSPVGEEARPILPGTPEPESAVAVIGAGTGLGMAALLPDGRGGFAAMPSEGGHGSFPFVSPEECTYMKFLLGELEDQYMTGNVVVSGRGLSLVHKYLTGQDLHPDEVSARFHECPDTLLWMSRFYGRACRDFALATLARGGVFVAGGVAARVPGILTHGAFASEFRSSPRHARLLRGIPVYLITDEDSGLWGAAYRGKLELEGARR
jgi:glucokinase